MLEGRADVADGDGGKRRPTVARPALAAKINRLFDTMHPAGQKPVSNAKAAADIRQRYGVDISANYLWMLRNGQRDNPTMRHLQALAQYFGVDAGYFFDTGRSAEIDSELELVAALRDAGVREVALRAAEVTEVSREAIREFAAHLARAETERGSRAAARRYGPGTDEQEGRM